MNRTRLAQLTAVLGAAVLLVLAVAITTGRDTNTVAGPASPLTTTMPAATSQPDTAESSEGTEPEGETSSAPAVPEAAVAPAEPDEAAGHGADESTSAPVGPTLEDEPGVTTPTNPPAETDPPASAAAAATEEDPLASVAASPSRDPFLPGVGPSVEASGPPSSTPAPSSAAPASPVPSSPGAPSSVPSTSASSSPPPSAEPTPERATRPASPAPATPRDPTVAPPVAPEVEAQTSDRYVVVAGDSLWEIAAGLVGPDGSNAEIAAVVADLYTANQHVVGADPDLILPGQQLLLPDG